MTEFSKDSRYNPLNFSKQELNETQKKEIELRRKRDEEDLRKILNLPFGRRFIWWLLTRICKIFLSSYSPDHSQMSLNEGMKNVGLIIMAEINKIDSLFIAKMASEEMSEKLKNKEKQKS